MPYTTVAVSKRPSSQSRKGRWEERLPGRGGGGGAGRGGGAVRPATSWSSSSVVGVPATMQRQVPAVL